MYTCYRMAQIVSRTLPRRFAYWLGLRIADHFYASDHDGRRAIMSNFRQILTMQGITASDKTLEQMARKNFQYFGKYLVDFFKFARFTPTVIRRLVSLEHIEYLEQAEALGRGIIFITAHLGNWELGGAILAAMGRRIHAVFLPHRENKINTLFQKHRSQRGLQCIPLGHAARGVMEALKHNECVAMLADRDFTAHHHPILFFGKPAHLSSGPARIAVKTQAPLVPTFLLRQPDDTFLLRLYPPIVPNPGTTVAELEEQIRDVLEQEIGRNPLQWFMFDDFWNPRRNHEFGPAP
ncbi:MAG: lysophospholipid acyltransferase family protein [Kiritimatiellae bacterium]|nr:lysophospholipid acyltransferase family protein [Kiritimatiellia bacterium]